PRQCWVLLRNISHNNVPIGTSDFPAFALPDILLVGTDLPAFRPLPMDRSVCLAPHLPRPPFDGCLIDLRDMADCIDTASFLGSVAHREHGYVPPEELTVGLSHRLLGGRIEGAMYVPDAFGLELGSGNPPLPLHRQKLGLVLIHPRSGEHRDAPRRHLEAGIPP